MRRWVSFRNGFGVNLSEDAIQIFAGPGDITSHHRSCRGTGGRTRRREDRLSRSFLAVQSDAIPAQQIGRRQPNRDRSIAGHPGASAAPRHAAGGVSFQSVRWPPAWPP
jgi:hypothetical protein